MLQRTMEAAYWIGRYVERVENHARCIEAWCTMHTPTSDRLLVHLVHQLGDVPDGKTMDALIPYLIWDKHHENSIVCCVEHARLNIKQSRSRLPDELYEQWNRLHLWLGEGDCARKFSESPVLFLRMIVRYVSATVGIAHQSMWRDDLWTAWRCGQFIERADHFTRFVSAICYWAFEQRALEPHALYPALTLLGGVDAYRHPMHDGVRVADCIALLVTNSKYPRSVVFALQALEDEMLLWANKKHEPSLHQLHARIVKLRMELALWSGDERAILHHLVSSIDDIGRALTDVMMTEVLL
jgi:uncharacterized alpha-E superfamily protein